MKKSSEVKSLLSIWNGNKKHNNLPSASIGKCTQRYGKLKAKIEIPIKFIKVGLKFMIYYQIRTTL